ncbi:hypothetical protein D8S78_03800 [Natrialba swarupiae]|nr:hypothetical protein [Natrialba swarupiae]
MRRVQAITCVAFTHQVSRINVLVRSTRWSYDLESDLVVRNATVPDRREPTTVVVSDGRIESITTESDDAGADGVPDVNGDELTTIDADGGLVAGGFVDPHVHLDKAYVAPDLPPNESGTLAEAIASIHERKADYTREDVRDRAIRAIEAHVRNGCTRIRTHVDVDTIGGLTPLEGVVAAREACADVADVEIVAFPGRDRTGRGDRRLTRARARVGADLIGGMPDNERTDADRRAHVDVCLDLAGCYDVGVDMHVDETDDPRRDHSSTSRPR